MKLSADLADIVGGNEMPRHEVTNLIVPVYCSNKCVSIDVYVNRVKTGYFGN